MTEFVPLDPAAEVLGNSVLGVLRALPPELALRGEALMEECGIRDPKPDSWYLQSAYLEWLGRLQAEFGSELLTRLGRPVSGTSRFPPEIRSLERAFRTLDVAYHLNHRGGEIGMYLFHATGPGRGEMHCQTPFGCAFDQGILLGLGDRFLPGAGLSIRHKEGTPCRREGAEACTCLLAW